MDSREAFEAWWASQDNGFRPIPRPPGIGYINAKADKAWEAWQAAERATAARCRELCEAVQDDPAKTVTASQECADAIAREFGLDKD